VPRAGLGPERVIGTAAELADAEGLDEVTLARVAQALGVKPPSLYNHVKGRDGLVRGIALLALAELAVVLREAAIGRSGPEALQTTAQAYRTYVLEHPGRYAAATPAPVPGDDEHFAAAAAVLDVLRGVLRAWDLEGDAEVYALRSFRAAVHGYATLEAAGGFGMKVDLDASFQRLIAALAEGLQVDHA
jgi:AcrR family transcriptional regulator